MRVAYLCLEVGANDRLAACHRVCPSGEEVSVGIGLRRRWAMLRQGDHRAIRPDTVAPAGGGRVIEQTEHPTERTTTIGGGRISPRLGDRELVVLPITPYLASAVDQLVVGIGGIDDKAPHIALAGTQAKAAGLARDRTKDGLLHT